MSHAAVIPHSRGRAANAALWLLQVALAAAFLGAGGSKLAGVPAMVALFDAVGVGQWFRYVTGALEVAGALLLLVPSRAWLGALLLASVAAGAVVAHLTVLGTSPAAPAGLLMGLAVVIAVRRGEIAARLQALRPPSRSRVAHITD